ncbi:hypothetical protein U9M48_005109 [Paspalum notatum var. saurae]|uniref:Transmembrane protein n=1 Tax=Paspalum notatum var. saurae TaxID=547442 RepID=A0AAQ3SJL7_PASNO
MASDSKQEEKKKKEKEGNEKKRPVLFDKSLGTAAGLSKLLPTGTTLAFQTMAPSFTNGGECEDHDVNFAFTWGLVGFLTLLCFTDSVIDEHGHTYYGVATPWGFKLFNHDLRDPQLLSESRRQAFEKRVKLKWQDFWSPPPAAHQMPVAAAVANLSKLLPTGTTLAFQTMAPSFTKGGDCSVVHGVNYAFTWGLIVLLTLLCAALCFTDSVTDEAGHTCYGVATVCGFRFFDRRCEQELRLSPPEKLEALKKKRKLRRRDFLHALTSAAVFLAIAFCDAGVQRCLVPSESNQWEQFLAILPLAVSFLASFVFLIYPSDRKGVGEEGGAWVDTVKRLGNKEQNKPPPPPSSLVVQAAMSSTRVAPSTSCVELEPLV